MSALVHKGRGSSTRGASVATVAGQGHASARLSVVQSVAEHLGLNEDELFGISELCGQFGITQRTIRFYEDKGLLNPKRINGTRVYTRRDRARLALILRAKALGSKLTEIKEFLDLYGMHGEGRKQQLQFVYKKTAAMIKQLEQKRVDLDITLAELTHINTHVRASLDRDAS